MKIYEAAVKKPVTTALIFVGVVILGLFSLTRLSVDLFPDIESNQVAIITSYAGASASDIETNVTRPIEDVLNTVENLKKITSQSKDNMSLVTLEFNYGINIDEATNDIRDKLDMVKSQLPDEVGNPLIVKFSMDMIPVVIYSATARESVNALYKILDDKVANPLNRVTGVGAVTIAGAPKRQVQVNVSPDKLETYQLTVEQIAAAIQQENLNVPAGNFDVGHSTYALRIEGEYTESSDMLNIVLGSRNGRNIYLRDVAVLNDTIQSRIQESYTNGVKGATIIVQKQSGANTVNIAKTVNRMIPELEKTLPPDVKLSLIMDTSDFIQASISSLEETIVLALLFVVVVVVFFLGRWRATFIVILAIPISLIISFVYLMVTGGTLNIISLSSISIAIGMVVDDAIVVLENITSHIERGSKPKEAAVYGTNEVAVAVMASTLTIVAVFFPLTMTTGLAGVMFGQLGWMVTIMIITSVAVALTLTPMLCSQMLRLTTTQGKFFDRLYLPIQRSLDRLDVFYEKVVDTAVKNRRKTFLACISLFVVILIASSFFIKFDFMPASDNDMITMNAYLPPATRMEVARDVAVRISEIVKDKYPEMRVASFSVGQADESNTFAAMQTNASNYISFRLRAVKAKDRKRDIYEMGDSLRNDLSAIPELYRYKVTPGGEGGMMGTGASTFDVEIYGHDLQVTDRIALEMKNRFAANVKGLRDITISRSDYRSEYQVDFDREKLAENGLNSATVATYIRNRINGLVTSKFREDGDEYDIVVQYEEKYRQSIEDLKNITVYNTSGIPVKIQELGTVREDFSLPQIDRQNRQRVVKVQSTLYKAALSEVVAEANQVIDQMKEEGIIPSEIGLTIGGSYEDQQDTNSDLVILMLLCVILVYIVMAAQFESLTYPFIIVISLVFGLGGVLLALMLTGQPLSLMSMIGLVMLIGIVVKNGIVLIDYINLNRERGLSVDKAVVRAGKSRLRPILMTTATTILGMIPMAIPRGQGSEMWQPMAVAIVGGLALSTVLTLIYVPALYSIFGGNGIRRTRKKFKKLYGHKKVASI
ncbi:MAG: efflux RND transporter permease subunit [Dysgonamonadaceae bacterium]|jgi:HAE1 family hydrophobic/amphiphilic exporter-1|nr:efflux RND transporter permease subunit [Dysgonamonadaceae bacterium]